MHKNKSARTEQDENNQFRISRADQFRSVGKIRQIRSRAAAVKMITIVIG
jgi:hypothetical protein